MNRELTGYLFAFFGLMLGGVSFSVFRSVAPYEMAFGAAIIGVGAGLGARLGGALGTATLLRFIIFGTLFTTLSAEYLVYEEFGPEIDHGSFTDYLLRDPLYLFFNIVFMAGGIFLGVRLLFAGR